MAEALMDSGVIKATRFHGDNDQTDIYAASSAGDEAQSVGVTHDELPMATITVKGIVMDCYY